MLSWLLNYFFKESRVVPKAQTVLISPDFYDTEEISKKRYLDLRTAYATLNYYSSSSKKIFCQFPGSFVVLVHIKDLQDPTLIQKKEEVTSPDNQQIETRSEVIDGTSKKIF